MKNEIGSFKGFPTGTCRFCGQILTLEVPAGSQEEADEWASMNCSCDASKTVQKIRKAVLDAKTQIDKLFGSEATFYGFEPVSDEIVVFLKSLVDRLAEGRFKKIKIQLAGFGSAGLSVSTAGKIKITRQMTTAAALETGGEK